MYIHGFPQSNRFSTLGQKWPYPILAVLFMPFGFIVPKHFKLFGSPIFQFWAYLVKVTAEMRGAHYIGYLRLYPNWSVYVQSYQRTFKVYLNGLMSCIMVWSVSIKTNLCWGFFIHSRHVVGYILVGYFYMFRLFFRVWVAVWLPFSTEEHEPNFNPRYYLQVLRFPNIFQRYTYYRILM